MVDSIKRLTSPTRPQQDPEAALVAAAKRDPAAFGKLYDRHVQALYRYVYSRIGSQSDAEDVTSQTFLAALEGLHRYHHRGYFSTWLFSIARNKAADYFRRQKKQTPLDATKEIMAGSDLLQDAIQAERVEALSGLIRALPEEEQELIRLRYVAELKFYEIAVIVGRNEEAVKKSVYRLLARLKDQMECQNE
jgi:RNA polymerase sigma-70 factor (ECF subfamily)